MTGRNAPPLRLLIDRLAAGEKLTRRELACLLEHRDGEHRDDLFARAREIQHRVFGNKVYIRGLIEFTNYCKTTVITAASAGTTAAPPATA